MCWGWTLVCACPCPCRALPCGTSCRRAPEASNSVFLARTQWAAVRKAWRAWREHVLAARMARKEACVDELRLAVVNLQQVRVCMCAHAHLLTELNLHVVPVRRVCPCACL